MKKYMINICYGDLDKRKKFQNPNNIEHLMSKYAEWNQKLGEKIIVAHKLKDNDGHVLTLNSGKIKDGPYTETKESIGGFYVIEAKNYEEAVEMAKDCPTLLYQGGFVEVREVEI